MGSDWLLVIRIRNSASAIAIALVSVLVEDPCPSGLAEVFTVPHFAGPF